MRKLIVVPLAALAFWGSDPLTRIDSWGLTPLVAAQQTAVWAPKPERLPGYTPPQRPHIKLSELKARHKGEQNWRELLVHDGYLQAEYIASAPGTSVSRRFHPDTRTWWVVVEGEMRVEIEGQEPFTASRGSLVQVPKQTLYSMTTTGAQPSLRFHVNVADAKTAFLRDGQPAPPAAPGVSWLPLLLNRTPAKYEDGNQPHINLPEAAKAPKYTGGQFVRDTRVNSAIIYGYEKDLPPLGPADKGHYHPDSPEFWLVLTGQIRYALENQDVFIADAGDVAYVPASTWHLARFHGPGPSARLAIVRFIGNTAVVER
jgi:quercetin dioxygenase-like cupin family protein